jgi:hypothetical protein
LPDREIGTLPSLSARVWNGIWQYGLSGRKAKRFSERLDRSQHLVAGSSLILLPFRSLDKAEPARLEADLPRPALPSA